MTPEKWLSQQIKESGLKQKYIAEKTGIPGFNEQKLSFCVTGYRRFRIEEFLTVCAVIGVNPLDCLPKKEEANA